MKASKETLLHRIDFLINKGEQAIEGCTRVSCDNALYKGFRAASLSFIVSLYKGKSAYLVSFNHAMYGSYVDAVKGGMSILRAIRDEVENDWLVSVKRLVTADIFNDFLEMAKYLLDQTYKDAAAVMIGSVLEENLRLLCKRFDIAVTFLKDNKEVPKKADVLNADLCKAEIYNLLEQKSVTSWLGLRNAAAHGKYDEYNLQQVEMMYMGVESFITRHL